MPGAKPGAHPDAEPASSAPQHAKHSSEIAPPVLVAGKVSIAERNDSSSLSGASGASEEASEVVNEPAAAVSYTHLTLPTKA